MSRNKPAAIGYQTSRASKESIAQGLVEKQGRAVKTKRQFRKRFHFTRDYAGEGHL